VIRLQSDITTSSRPSRSIRRKDAVATVTGVAVTAHAGKVTARGDGVAFIGGVSATLRTANSRPGGRPRKSDENKNCFDVGAAVEKAIPTFSRLFKRKAEPEGALRRAFSPKFVDVAFHSRTVEAAARRLVSDQLGLAYDTVANYHRSYQKLATRQAH
jgi:hypothetical protein